jgi:tRNA dimethylallyltransferase
MKPILGILGATGVGKSAVAVEIALKLGANHVISADSMQIYRGMDVGTAKITSAESKGVTHYLIDVVNPDQSFSAFDFAQMANQIVSKHADQTNVVVGGTGLYFDALLHGLDFASDDQTQKIRQDMQQLLQNQGAEAVLEVLKSLDSQVYYQIDKNNLKRVVRAIEILSTGGNLQDKPTKRKDLLPHLLFVLYRDRADTYQKINDRVDKMVEEGLLQEVEQLYKRYPSRNLQSFKAIGYKEVLDHLDGLCTFEQAVEAIKVNTRHYAKRQNTYFKRMQNTVWVNVDGKTPNQIADEILTIYQNSIENTSK